MCWKSFSHSREGEAVADASCVGFGVRVDGTINVNAMLKYDVDQDMSRNI